MWPTAKIGGVVTDESGTPVQNVQVRLLRRQLLGGRPYFIPSTIAMTNADGRYEFANLAPSAFVVALLPVTKPGALAPAIFYPQAPSASLAELIELKPGDLRLPLDFVRRVVPGVQITGRVEGELPAGSLELSLSPAFPSLPDAFIGTAKATVDNEGRFEFPPVAPGRYVIRGVKYPTWDKTKEGEPSFNGEGMLAVTSKVIGVPTSDPTWWLEQVVSVPPRDFGEVTTVTLRLRSGIRVAGRVEFVGTSPKPDPGLLPTRAVSIRSLDARFSDVFMATRIESDGMFRSIGIPPGRYQIGPSQAFPGWTVESIRSGTRELLGGPVDIDTDLTDIVITFVDKPTRMLGTITDGQNALAGDARLLVFPVDDAFWGASGTQMPTRAQLVAPMPPPSYSVPIWPGTYFVIAFTGEIPEFWEAPEFLRSLVPFATRVTIAPGTTATVNVQARRVR
jgi:hypothetical protein